MFHTVRNLHLWLNSKNTSQRTHLLLYLTINVDTMYLDDILILSNTNILMLNTVTSDSRIFWISTHPFFKVNWTHAFAIKGIVLLFYRQFVLVGDVNHHNLVATENLLHQGYPFYKLLNTFIKCYYTYIKVQFYMHVWYFPPMVLWRYN